MDLRDKPIRLLRRGATLALVVGCCACWRALAQPVPDLDLDPHPDIVRLVALSGGPPSAGEIAKFDEIWMTEGSKESMRYWICQLLYERSDAAAWDGTEKINAMARMFDLTRDPKYIEQLAKHVDCALKYRDDRHAGPKPCAAPGEAGPPCEPLARARYLRPRPRDEVRAAQALPAWGGRSINSANLHRVSEVISGIYAHSIATFARIVFEDSRLRQPYGALALDATNAGLETMALFLEQFENRPDGTFHQGFFIQHHGLANRWSKPDCDRAFNDTIEAESPDQAGRNRYERQLKNCKNFVDLQLAGKPMSHNENHALAMAMIELHRAINTEFYRQSTPQSALAAFARGAYPVFVSRIQRYFRRKLGTRGASTSTRYIWNHSEITDRLEDASHGGLSMQYVRLLSRDIERLAAVAGQAEPIAFEPLDLQRFANTFLNMTTGPNVAKRVDGDRSEVDNGVCFSWIDLSVVDQRVYERCRKVALRVEAGTQPYLSIGNHAGLLANGRTR